MGYSGDETELTLPENYKRANYEIYHSAFYECDKLIGIIIGDSVTKIGEYSFAYCGKLQEIKYCGSEEKWNAIAKASNWNYGTNATISYNYSEEN